RNTAVTAIRLYHRIHAVKLAVNLFSFQKIKHSFHQVVNIKKFQFGTPVIYMKFFIIGHRPAEGADSAVVLWPGMPHQIWKAVNRYLRSGFPSIREKQILTGFLGPTIRRVAETSGQSSLDGGRQHNRNLVILLLQSIQTRTD